MPEAASGPAAPRPPATPDPHAGIDAATVAAPGPADCHATRGPEGTDAGPGARNGGHHPPPPSDAYATRPATVGASTSAGQRFRILRPHARGGLGQVSVALDQELHREVALKEIQERHADRPESRSRFILEAEITGRLEHPGVVPVYGLGQYADGRPYYAMRFIQGDSLQDAIDRFHRPDPGRDPGQRLVELRHLLDRFVAVCNAVAFAHNRGVLHRDLKPANVMLGRYGETLVVDWGLAKPVGQAEHAAASGERPLLPVAASAADATVMGNAVGTPQFMSPEQAAGRLDELGPASDVYSLGATLYALLTGRPPVEGGDVGLVLQKVQKGDFPRPRQVKADVPAPLEAVCQKAMALRPADRYRSATELADDVEQWLADEPVSAWVEPWGVRARRWLGRHRGWVTTAGVAVALTVVGLTVLAIVMTTLKERERTAKERAQAAEQEAREQRDEAHRQQARAEENFALARRAVDRYYTQVSEDILLYEPGMEPVRQKLLVTAREFYDDFVRRRGADPALQADLGRALYRLANISAEVDSRYAGIALQRQALVVFTRLAAEKPDDLEVRAELAACQHALGRLYRLTDQEDQARAACTRALELRRGLVDASPATSAYRADLASSLLGLGNIYQRLRQREPARAAYEQALALREKLAEEEPANAGYQRDLAVSLKNLGTLLSATGDADRARAAYGRAVTIQEKLSHEHPYIKQYQDDLAGSLASLALLAAKTGRTAEAEGLYRRAADVWKKLAADHPAVTDYHMSLAGTYNLLGSLYRRTGRAADAERTYRLAQEVAASAEQAHRQAARADAKEGQAPDVPQHQAERAAFYRNLANVYRTSGRTDRAEASYRAALAIQEKLAREHPGIPQYQGDLAGTYNDLGLLHVAAGRKEQAEESFRKALAIWDKMVEGEARSAEDVINLAGACLNLGDLARERGRPEAAVGLYDRALLKVGPVLAEQAWQAQARHIARNAHWGRAVALGQLGRHPQALEDWGKAIELSDAGSVAFFRLYRLATVARMGNYPAATREAEELVPRAAHSGEALYHLAAVFALSASAARQDVNLATAERDQLAGRYAARAVELLTGARAAGQLRSAQALDRLEQDNDFAALRPRADFQKLLAEWRKQAKAG